MDTTTYNHSAKVCVIVPMYNAAAFLKATVSSILAQSYKDFELLLIDDCSTDNTLQIAHSFPDPRIRVIKNEINQGAGATRNRGIECALSDYMAFCDADDIMLPDRLEKQFNFMEQHPDIDICGSFVKLINEKGDVIGKYTFPTRHEEIAVAMFLRCAFQQSTAFIRCHSFRQSELRYKENHYAEDFDLWANAVKKLKFHILPQFLMYYKISESQLSATSWDKQQRDAFLTYEQMMSELGVKQNKHIIAVHYELAHRKGTTLPKEWIQEYEGFCRECLSRNKQVQLYDGSIWQRAIVHNYKKSQHLLHNKVIATLKAFLKFKI